jgi:hypothetical protein
MIYQQLELLCEESEKGKVNNVFIFMCKSTRLPDFTQCRSNDIEFKFMLIGNRDKEYAVELMLNESTSIRNKSSLICEGKYNEEEDYECHFHIYFPPFQIEKLKLNYFFVFVYATFHFHLVVKFFFIFVK